MTLTEAVGKIVARKIFGSEEAILSHVVVVDYIDRLTHSEIVDLLSEAMEKMKEDK